MISRRDVLRIGGGVLAGLVGSRLPLAGEPVEIRMQGNTDGSHVWFDPVGLRVQPGQTIRGINLDPGNSHTATAYHPKNFDHPLRIPEGAEP
jgi:plastocyanin